jgi:hypothetical protein
MTSPWLRRLALAVMVVSLCLSVYRVATSLDHYQWDFRLTYYASQASAAGLNPYDVQRLIDFSGGRSTLNYSDRLRASRTSRPPRCFLRSRALVSYA